MKDAPNKRIGLILAIILLAVISACQPTKTLPIVASRQPTPIVPAVSPTAGTEITIPAETPTALLPSIRTLTPTPASPEEIQLPVQTPSMMMGKGSPTALAVSPNGQWMAVSTQFGVYLYDASKFGAALVVHSPA